MTTLGEIRDQHRHQQPHVGFLVIPYYCWSPHTSSPHHIRVTRLIDSTDHRSDGAFLKFDYDCLGNCGFNCDGNEYGFSRFGLDMAEALFPDQNDGDVYIATDQRCSARIHVFDQDCQCGVAIVDELHSIKTRTMMILYFTARCAYCGHMGTYDTSMTFRPERWRAIAAALFPN